MGFDEDFHRHIVTGDADDATPLMARIALNLGCDSDAYPVDVSELRKIRHFERSPSRCGLNELLVLECLRRHLAGEGPRWSSEQAEALKLVVEHIAEPPIRIRGIGIKAQLAVLGLREWSDNGG